MCLAVPMELVDLRPPAGDGVRLGTVEFGGLRRQVRLDLLDEPKLGDHLLIHAGFAIQVIDVAEAERMLALLEELVGAESAGEAEE
jgi:hydrogenase expression/formation protein HypC